MGTALSAASINVEAFLQNSLFGALAHDKLRSLASHACVEVFDSYHVINEQGSALKMLRLVIEGGVTVSAHHASGKQVLISLVGPGGWAAWLPCFVQAPLDTEFAAEAATVCIALPTAVVRACFDSSPQLYPLLMVEIGKRMRLLMEWTSQSALLTAEKRLARLITLLAKDRNLGLGNTVLTITQSQMATLIGCSRQSASKFVRSLEAKSLINMAYGKCEIPDLAALRKYSEQPD